MSTEGGKDTGSRQSGSFYQTTFSRVGGCGCIPQPDRTGALRWGASHRLGPCGSGGQRAVGTCLAPNVVGH